MVVLAEMLALFYRLLRGAWRWVTAAGPPRDRKLRVALAASVSFMLVVVFVVFPVVMILAMFGVDATWPLTVLAAVVLTIVGIASVTWLRSRQVSSVEPPSSGDGERSEACSVCQKPRQRLAFLRAWRYCPECEAAYCQDCRGLLWTSAARGWTAECLECRHEWSVPLD